MHDRLPRATVMLYRMGHPRLWAFAARQRLPQDAERAVPDSFHRDITGPYTTPEEAWLGMYVADATRLGELNTQVDGAGLDEDRQQRLRLGMSLADTYRQVWSSARGHWRVSPQTRYIVPSRFGYCPFVFRVAEGGWRRDSFEGSHDRFMATEGYWIDVERERLIHLGAPDPHDACCLRRGSRPKHRRRKTWPSPGCSAGKSLPLVPARKTLRFACVRRTAH